MFAFLADPAVESDDAGRGVATVAPQGPAHAARDARVAAQGPRERRHRKMCFGVFRKRLGAVERQRDVVAAIANPSKNESISQEIFGFGTKYNGSQKLSASMTCGFDVHFMIDKARSKGRLLNCGVSQHMAAVRLRLPKLMSRKHLLLVMDVLDDATMWCKRPDNTAAEKKSRAADAKRSVRKKLKGKKPGKVSTVQVMNVLQHVFLKGPPAPDGHPWAAAQVHSPAIAVPKANFGTLAHRRRPWAVNFGGQVGHRLQKDNEVQEHMDETPTIVKVVTNDAASNNLSMIGLEQREFCSVRRPDSDKFRAHVDWRCMCHAACLITKPAYSSLGDLPTVVTRLSHLFQNSRTLTRFLESCDIVLDSTFRYLPAFRLPGEAALWRRDAQWVLRPSLMAKELTDEDAAAIVAHANGNWQGEEYTHFCVQPCPAGCRDEAESRQVAKDLIRRMLSRGLPVALLYRWKAMDACLAYLARGRGCFDILGKAFRKMWKGVDLLAAQAEGEAAEDPSELSFQTKAAIKASSVVSHLARDPGGRDVSAAILLTGPAQHFLNKAMTADAVVCALNDASTMAAPNLEERRLEALKINYEFVVGNEAGKLYRSTPRW